MIHSEEEVTRYPWPRDLGDHSTHLKCPKNICRKTFIEAVAAWVVCLFLCNSGLGKLLITRMKQSTFMLAVLLSLSKKYGPMIHRDETAYHAFTLELWSFFLIRFPLVRRLLIHSSVALLLRSTLNGTF